MSAAKFRVAICGGGIGGLCLAVALSQYADIEVDIYEAAERFKEIGAGVMIWSRTWRILSLLGVASEFAEIAHAPPDGSLGVGFDYRKSDKPKEGFRFHLFELPYGCIRFHRAQFLDVLVNRLPDGVAHFGKRLSTYSHQEPSGPIYLQFSDGSKAVCDLLVACDGIKSVVRQQLLQELATVGEHAFLNVIDPVWTGTIAYRGLIPVERLISADGQEHRTVRTPMMYCGKSKHVVSYSISGGSIVNVVAFASQPEKDGYPCNNPWVSDCSRQELLDCYADWEPEVIELLQRIEHPTRWAIHQLRPLPTYMSDRVVLLGDAAHAMSPHQGAGAGQAIEDAYILAHLLGHPDTAIDTLGNALSAYEHVRLPLANRVLQGSRESGMLYEFNGVYQDDLQALGQTIERQWDWLVETTPEEEADRAVEWMRQRGKLSATCIP